MRRRTRNLSKCSARHSDRYRCYTTPPPVDVPPRAPASLPPRMRQPSIPDAESVTIPVAPSRVAPFTAFDLPLLCAPREPAALLPLIDAGQSSGDVSNISPDAAAPSSSGSELGWYHASLLGIDPNAFEREDRYGGRPTTASLDLAEIPSRANATRNSNADFSEIATQPSDSAWNFNAVR